MIEMLDLLQVPSARTVVDEEGPIEVGELLVPDPGFEVQRFLHPWLRSRYEICDAAPTGGHLRLWLSRSALGDLAGVAEEREIESRLASIGWTVAHPETLPLQDQIDLLAGASHVAGIEGSAFHTMLFVRNYRGTIDLVTRHDSANFEVIAGAARWDQVRHPMPGGRASEWNRSSGARDVRWSGVDVDAVVRAVVASSCG
jgi:capsular polysaccharide biosynthesis protein